MKLLKLITFAIVISATSTAKTYAQTTNAPLSLFIVGGGSVSPLTNGESLVVGQNYNMVASPDAGFAFTGWQPVNVFTFTEVALDQYGNPLPPVVSTVVSPVPAYTYEASLSFVMQPVTVIYDVPGRTVTEGTGWQANFEPVVLSIQLSVSAVVVSWTNSSYTLQSAPAPLGPYASILGAASPYTNNLTGPSQYFRLVSP
jgi:hypothetical protein